MAARTAGNRPSEFGGVPGLYGDADFSQGAIKGILTPEQSRMALHQTPSDDATALPSHGDGGKKVQ